MDTPYGANVVPRERQEPSAGGRSLAGILIAMPHRKKILWRSPKGDVIGCVEKNKVLQENLAEIRQVCQDALEDAVLMGCDEQQFRAVLAELVNGLENPYPPQD